MSLRLDVPGTHTVAWNGFDNDAGGWGWIQGWQKQFDFGQMKLRVVSIEN